MTRKKPIPVSIILPVYNAEVYLPETLDSILRQTFRDFELIAVNDGSSDNSLSILEEYAKRDERIVVIDQKNKGLVATLNDTIKKASGTYIARVDADDPSFDRRLSAQVTFLDNNRETVLVGGGFEIIDQDGFFMETIHAPTRDEDIRRTMMLRNPFGHAGVMFRADAFNKTDGYSNQYGPTEDFDLWIKLSRLGRVANIPSAVYRYRVVESGISQSSSDIQAKYANEHISNLWADATPRVLSRREVKKQADRYLHAQIRHTYAVGLKEQFLMDNAQIGVKLIRHGHFMKGISQLINVASVGRSGLRAVKKRLTYIDAGSIKKALRSKIHD